MSGRSGYVRAEQASRSRSKYQKSPKKLNTQIDSTTSQTTFSSFLCPSENRSIDIPNTTSQDLKLISTTTNLGSHTATCSECLPSQLQKSPFRTKIDQKSVKCINEIRRAFGMEKEKKLRSKSSASYIEHIDLKKSSQLYESSNSFKSYTYGHTHTCCQNNLPEKITSQLPSRHVQLRRWYGMGKNVEPWAKIRKDPELFDSFGDTLIFFCDVKTNIPFPGPSLRISSHFIEATGSRILINILRENCIVDGLRSSQKKNEFSRTFHSSQNCQFDGQVSYEIFFPSPHGLSEIEAQNQQVTTRNMFALLLNASLVGQTLYQALYDLRNRMVEYMPGDVDITRMIIDWIKRRGIDDPRHSLSSAFSLLAWSEDDNVCWEEGWSEAFCHAVGMRALKSDQKLELIPEFQYLSPITKTLLSRFSVDTQLLVKGCQYRLCNFDFTDMWDVANQKISTGRSAFNRLRKFLVQHYHKVFGSWPPDITDGKEYWLTRTIAKKLSHDFGALYDYLVNRSISWDFNEEHTGRKWNMKCADNQNFDPDTTQLPISDMIISFDDRMGYPHIPYPYCLTPEPVLAQSNLKLSKRAGKNTRHQEELMQERQAEMAYQDSTNIYILGSDFVSNDLVDSFTNFEKEERSQDMDLYNCRRGRWVLIYGILQVLASISVDTPQLRYVENVDYHLQSPLRGTPPWRGADKSRPEAEHTGSHCWLIPNQWSSLRVVETESQSSPSSHAYNTKVTSNIDSAPDNTNRLSSSSYDSSNISLSLESSTLNNLNISPDRVPRKLCSSCSLASYRETLGQEWDCNSGIKNSRKILSPCQSIDPFTYSMDSQVISPLPLRSSHLRRVKNSIKLSSREVSQVHSDYQNLIRTPLVFNQDRSSPKFEGYKPPVIDKELA